MCWCTVVIQDNRKDKDMDENKTGAAEQPPDPVVIEVVKGLTPDIKQALDAWVERGQRPGHFLTAVLENNLVTAIQRADDKSFKALTAIVQYLYWEVVGECWGSSEKVRKWEMKKQGRPDRRGGGQ